MLRRVVSVRLFGVLFRKAAVRMGNVRVIPRLFVVAGIVLLRRLAMVARGLLVLLSRLAMVFRLVVGHRHTSLGKVMGA
jgi:hypothetical protein